MSPKFHFWTKVTMKSDLEKKALVRVDFNYSILNYVNVTLGYFFSSGICAITISYSTLIKSSPSNSINEEDIFKPIACALTRLHNNNMLQIKRKHTPFVSVTYD